jgi:hypothetical protein
MSQQVKPQNCHAQPAQAAAQQLGCSSGLCWRRMVIFGSSYPLTSPPAPTKQMLNYPPRAYGQRTFHQNVQRDHG